MFKSKLTVLLILLSLLSSGCSVQDSSRIQSIEEQIDTGRMTLYPEWQQLSHSKDKSSANSAVNELLFQADQLIAARKLELATDKLERLLRIDPASAQAWSRLSWIALESGNAKRSYQMAQRSNIYAAKNSGLQKRNWIFIRDAAEILNDFETLHKAEQVLNDLEVN